MLRGLIVMANKQINVTRNYQFLRCNSANQQLFAVQEGVPAADALSESSWILASVVSLLGGIEDSDEVYAALYLVRMAKAVVDSVGVFDD